MLNQKKTLHVSFILLAISVALGAIGAHLLEKSLSPKSIDTFNTGIKYLTYHSLALLAFSSHEKIFHQLIWAKRLIFIGIIFFSGNCIAYALSGIKTFAMLLPIGGFAFIFAWLIAVVEVKEVR